MNRILYFMLLILIITCAGCTKDEKNAATKESTSPDNSGTVQSAEEPPAPEQAPVIESVQLKYGTITKGQSISDVMQIVDKSVTKEADRKNRASALLTNISGSSTEMRFALNDRQYELSFTRNTTPWSLVSIVEKPFNLNDFPESAILKFVEISKEKAIVIQKVRIYQDPNGSNYAGWETGVAFTLRNTSDQKIESIPFALIAYDSNGTPDLARFGPGAGQYSFWGEAMGGLQPGQAKRTKAFSIGVLYRRPTKIKVIVLNDAMSEGVAVSMD